MAPSNNVLTAKEVMYLIHHVFLPPKVPQKDDWDIPFDVALVRTIVDCLERFKVCVDQSTVINPIVAAVASLSNVCDSAGTISEKNLAAALKNLTFQGKLLFAPLFVVTSIHLKLYVRLM